MEPTSLLAQKLELDAEIRTLKAEKEIIIQSREFRPKEWWVQYHKNLNEKEKARDYLVLELSKLKAQRQDTFQSNQGKLEKLVSALKGLAQPLPEEIQLLLTPS